MGHHKEMHMGTGEYVTIAIGLGIAGFLWSLHRDMGSLGERLARLEGSVDTLKDILTGRDRHERP